MLWIFNTITILIAFLFMEFTAWFTHKYIMHGFLWVLHKDHHTREHQPFEWNDLFALIFAIPSFLLIYTGAAAGFDLKFYLGLGIAAYGLGYFIFHDALVHRRISVFDKTQNRFLKAVYSAHVDHHRGKKNYGFLFIFPPKYFKPENQYELYSVNYGPPGKN